MRTFGGVLLIGFAILFGVGTAAHAVRFLMYAIPLLQGTQTAYGTGIVAGSGVGAVLFGAIAYKLWGKGMRMIKGAEPAAGAPS